MKEKQDSKGLLYARERRLILHLVGGSLLLSLMAGCASPAVPELNQETSDTPAAAQPDEKSQPAEEKPLEDDFERHLERADRILAKLYAQQDSLDGEDEDTLQLLFSEAEDGVLGLDLALSLRPDSAAAYEKKGILLYFLGKYAEATHALNAAIDLNAENYTLFYYQGRALARFFVSVQDTRALQATVPETQAALDAAIALEPQRYEAYEAKGYLAMVLGEYKTAIAELGRAIERNPEAAFSYESRGLAHNALFEYDQALADYEAALKLKPYRSKLHILMFQIHYLRGDYAAAVENLKRAESLDGHLSHENYSSLAYAYVQTGAYAEAIALYTDRLQIDTVGNHQDFTLRGAAYLALEDYEKALVDFKQALAKTPNDLGAMHNLGVTHYQSGNSDAALEQFDRAVSLKTDNAKTYLYRGQIHYEAKADAKALADFKQAIALQADDALPHYNLGLVSLRQGDEEQALASLKRAFELDAALKAEARSDQDLAPLRGNAEFDALVAEE